MRSAYLSDNNSDLDKSHGDKGSDRKDDAVSGSGGNSNSNNTNNTNKKRSCAAFNDVFDPLLPEPKRAAVTFLDLAAKYAVERTPVRVAQHPAPALVCPSDTAINGAVDSADVNPHPSFRVSIVGAASHTASHGTYPQTLAVPHVAVAVHGAVESADNALDATISTSAAVAPGSVEMSDGELINATSDGEQIEAVNSETGEFRLSKLDQRYTLAVKRL
jgi:hypothetical protein